MREELKHKPILLFDGYCNFCSSVVQFVNKREKRQELYFASLQSDIGRELLAHYGIDPVKTDSLVLIDRDKAFIKSGAALRLTRYMKALYPLLQIFLAVPSPIRNLVYDFIARRRYKWFGRSESCMLPDKELARRFL